MPIVIKQHGFDTSQYLTPMPVAESTKPQFSIEDQQLWIKLIARGIMIGDGMNFWRHTRATYFPGWNTLNRPLTDFGQALTACYCVNCGTVHQRNSDRIAVCYCSNCTQPPTNAQYMLAYGINDRLSVWKPKHQQELLDCMTLVYKNQLTKS